MPGAAPSDDILMEPVMRQHAAALQALASHPEVSATSHLPAPFPPGHAEAWIDTAMAARAKGEAFHNCLAVHGIESAEVRVFPAVATPTSLKARFNYNGVDYVPTDKFLVPHMLPRRETRHWNEQTLLITG